MLAGRNCRSFDYRILKVDIEFDNSQEVATVWIVSAEISRRCRGEGFCSQHQLRPSSIAAETNAGAYQSPELSDI